MLNLPGNKVPTYQEVIAAILEIRTGPVPIKELVEQVLALRPSKAKDPPRLVRSNIKDSAGRELIYLDQHTVLPLRLAMQGVRFRHPLDRKTIKNGRLNYVRVLESYLPNDLVMDDVRFLDTAGEPIPLKWSTIQRKMDTILGPRTIPVPLVDLSAWFRAQKVVAGDHLLFTILDWTQGVVRLEREPARQRDAARIAQRNRLLADLWFSMLESAPYEMISTREAIPTAYARLPDKDGYPPDHWTAIIEADGRMKSDKYTITYKDASPSPLELIFGDFRSESRKAPPKQVGQEQAGKVFRFKAALANSPSIWRRVELLGKHTLADLDSQLRGAFAHDSSDHLSGFWQRIPRGTREDQAEDKPKTKKRRRFREVDLGDINPSGGGDAANVKIAGIGLEVGHQLKYVYDFGDWIEHRLTLEAIEEPEQGVDYPREAGRNKPRYKDCVECRERGQQQTAHWNCLTCSYKLDEAVLLCEKCADEHEKQGHYLNEILY